MNNEITSTAPAETEEHGYLFEVLIGFWVEIFEFFKYIFNDIFLGK